MHTALRILSLSVGIAALLCRAHAEDLTEELRKHVADLSKKVESERGATSARDSKRVREKVADIESQVIVPKAQSSAIPLLSHQRDDRGLAFPSGEAVVFKPAPTPTPQPVSSKGIAVAVPTPRPYTRYPRACERHETKSIARGTTGDGNRIVYDVLYLPENLVPSDPTEVFGVHTSLRPYGPNSGEGVHVRMEVDEVPCVPYRTRITGTTEYVDLGRNALKNYDKKPSGEGEFHPWMTQKLFGAE